MAWEVIRTEPIIVRLHCSLTQYLNGPGGLHFSLIPSIERCVVCVQRDDCAFGNSESDCGCVHGDVSVPSHPDRDASLPL